LRTTADHVRGTGRGKIIKLRLTGGSKGVASSEASKSFMVMDNPDAKTNASLRRE
jgi:hypothetical protein